MPSMWQFIDRTASPYFRRATAFLRKLLGILRFHSVALLGSLFPSIRAIAAPAADDDDTFRGFTAAELCEFDGNGDETTPIYLSLKRRVFHVPRNLYGPQSPYTVFAGTDCSRNLAKNSIADDEANADFSSLSKTEKATLDRWYGHFLSKYETVGWFIPDEDYFANGEKFASQSVLEKETPFPI